MPNQKLQRFILALFFIVLFADPALPQQAAEQVVSGKLIEIKIPAPSLRGNLLGDPPEQYVTIYLPPGYDASPAKRYPTVYLLHPGGGSNKTWTNNDPARINIPIKPALDALMSGGKIREMIVVGPNGKNAYIGSFYSNSPVTGNWEDYIYRDVVAYVDSNFRTLARPSSRGIAGHSMGGFGATFIAMKHPDVFSALYALSPCCMGMEGDFNEANPAWKRAGDLTSRDQLPVPKSLDDFYTNIFVAMSASFSPTPGALRFMAIFCIGNERGNLRETMLFWPNGNRECLFTWSRITRKIFLHCAGYLLTMDKESSFHTFELPALCFQAPWQSEAFRTALKFTREELTLTRSKSGWKRGCFSFFPTSWISQTLK